MIKVAPGTLARLVLEVVVEAPGELDAETIATRVLPATPLQLPLAPHAARAKAYTAWQDAELGPLTPDPHDPTRQVRKGGRRDQATTRVSRILGRLQELHLIETRGPPVLAPWWLKTMARLDIEDAIRTSMDEDTERASVTPHIAMVREVEKGPTSAAALLGPSPSGARKRTYDDLVTWGIVIPPSQRWPTAKGRALILSEAEDSAPSLSSISQ